MFQWRASRGFTLIELLVVISIIGMLSSIVLASLNSARAKSRNASTQAQVNQIVLAVSLARDTLGRYPGSQNNWYCMKSSGGCWLNNYAGDATLISEMQPYMSSIPKPAVQMDSSNRIYDAYLYYPNHPGVGGYPPGAYIIYALEGAFTTCQGYYSGNSDGNLYYCYHYIGN